MIGATEVGKRPISITLVSLLFILSGTLGLVYHGWPLVHSIFNGSIATWDRRELIETVVILLIRVLAIVGGVFLLKGRNWARWICVGWMAFHVVISFWHDMSSVITHAVLLVLIAILLFRPSVNDYFREARP
jgi:hypothetical protein